MKTKTLMLAASVALSGGVAQAALTALVPDSDTTFLFHFDEDAGSGIATNAVSGGANAAGFDNVYAGDNTDQTLITTSSGATGFTGFGNAADVSGNRAYGVDGDGSGAFRAHDNAPNSSPDDILQSSILGAGGSFTLEALVNVSQITGLQQHIIATDSNNAVGERGFQFRINTTGNLEFNFISTDSGANPVLAAIPTVGAHAFAADEWFHAAISFESGTASLYWTRVDEIHTEANLIGSGPESLDLTFSSPLVIGNEGRSLNNRNAGQAAGFDESLEGLIDEVRISSVARGADEFIFTVPEPSTALFSALGALGLMRRRRA